MPASPLTLFHPLIASWFREEVGQPTAVQAAAWPVIAGGGHVLVTAPTGTGKTLTAFLWSLDRLLTGAWPPGAVRVLYVSPLKALNTDIRRNLLGPLAAIRRRFEEAGEPFPDVEVMTRSGDTAVAERQRMLRRPPAILITTPESLNLLLASPRARGVLTGLRTVILDEIHAVAPTKRGTHLITAVERLVPLAGELQRVALSATVRPLERIARFVGGYRAEGDPAAPEYVPREVAVVRAEAAKRYETEVRYPTTPSDLERPERWWPDVAAELKQVIRSNRSTLIFTNSRRQAERLTLLINEGEHPPLAYSHHGSLSRETRAVVEERLKRGELAAIVATSSLEMGIDIGALDEVVLVETPREVAAAIQRLGRAGHAVGQVSRGRLFPTFGRDFVNATVLARCIANQDIEAIHPIEGALDVLAQMLVAMCGVETWHLDELYAFVRCAAPYHALPRRQFDLVVAMLGGRYAASRLPALQARLLVDRLANTARARDGALREVYQAGGTIPDRGYYQLRHQTSRAVIGELDEEFVWERRLGDTFLMGSQAWRIEQITHNDVFVVPTRQTAGAPFWRGEFLNRGSHFSDRIAEFLEQAEARLDDPGYRDQLASEYGLTIPAAAEVVGVLTAQQRATGTALPHRGHLVVERVDPHEAGADGTRIVLHTLWGGPLNRPYGLALAAAWEERFGCSVGVYADNDCVVLNPSLEVRTEEILSLVPPDGLEPLLRERLESSGLFGALFRECAGRALLLGRGTRDQRMPLWLSRTRSRKLLEVVTRYEDFPILTETWRSCLADEFELDALREKLRDLEAGRIRWSEAHTSQASPFAANVVWRQTNVLMYEDDTPASGKSRLADDLLREVVFSPRLRPALSAALCDTFAAKLQRRHPGYAPRTPDELLTLVKERLLIAEADWADLLAAIAADHDDDLLPEVADRLATIRLPGATARAVVALENLTLLAAAAGADPAAVEVVTAASPRDLAAAWSLPLLVEDDDPLAEVVAGWLQFTGPVLPDRLADLLGVDRQRLDAALDDLAQAERVVLDRLREDAAALEVCDADHLERLLRLARRERAPVFEPLPVSRLALLLARRQGLLQRETGRSGLQRTLDPLLGYPAPAGLWESEFLPARLPEYQTAWLDSLFGETDLGWFGCGPRQVLLAFPDQLDLFRDGPLPDPELALPAGRRSLDELAAETGLPTGELIDRLWATVWAGQATNDTFAALRQGLHQRFAPGQVTPPPGRRGGPQRWQSSRIYSGGWAAVPPPAELDPLDELELHKDRVRVLLDRWGILFRELLARELPALQWGRLFRALRLMELSGELVGGCFLEGVPGLQFTTPAGLALLRWEATDEPVYWVNATDPACLCGLGLDALADLPERRASNVLVYRGETLVVVARRNGQELELRCEPDDPRLPEYLRFLGERQRRQFEPLGNLRLETINGEPADQSPFLEALRQCYHLAVGFRDVTVWRQVK